jgi:nucleotide-binding universal stress UspA family protein
VAKAEPPQQTFTPRQAHREVAERADNVAAQVADLLKASGVKADSVVRFGESHHAIIDEAVDWTADLIIMSRYYNGVTQSSTTNEPVQWIASHAPCSVKLVPA